MSETRLCIHGHFYQPPRENPWLEAVEVQESAAPFHNWNERIHRECYLPNARAHVLDGSGRIVDVVNNYESLSFNFGPTLLGWIRDRHPETYELIREADGSSASARGGHGNAIAQAYNHLILPLANRRDKRTQAIWGVKDFEFHFGRRPEAMWLPETACNEETLEVLVEQGMKYAILEPHQAQAVRPLGGGDWQDVGDGRIDPKRAYRAFLKSDPKKFIDLFFYDGPISKAAGFEDLLFDAKRFAERLAGSRSDSSEPQLLHLSTDGETYGHHKPFGDRVLAYLFRVEAPARGLEATNYGEFLAAHPPAWEVKIKEGENGEGTSWSCAHGVRRWRDDCGCRGDGPAEWRQEWRKPLREAFDRLRDDLATLFEENTRGIFSDPWSARDRYIEAVLDRSETTIGRFLRREAGRDLTRQESVRAMKLLEMQRHAMLMYTSCGWFFTELSGIETVQVIQYAARAIQLAEEVSGRRIEEAFVERLAEAKSNIPEIGDGRVLWDRCVKPAVISLRRVAGFYAIGSVFDDYFPHGDKISFYGFDLEVIEQRRETHGQVTLNLGRVRVRSRVTLDEKEFAFAALRGGVYDFRCRVATLPNERVGGIEGGFFHALESMDVIGLLKKIEERFPEKAYGLNDLLREDRLRIISLLTRDVIGKLSETYEALYDETLKMNEAYRSLNLPIPPEIRFAAEHTLSRRLERETRAIAARGFEPSRWQSARRQSDLAVSLGLALDKRGTAKFLSEELAARAQRLQEAPDSAPLEEAIRLCELAETLGIELERSEAQAALFRLLKSELWTANGHAAALARLAPLLGIDADIYGRALETSAEAARVR